MTNKIILKKSSVASKSPSTTDLDYGELAINYTDGKLYFKDSSNVINSFDSSATDLLNKIKTVDGAGSGLDADTLDGYNIGTSGSAIPLLNANNTFSGVTSFGEIRNTGANLQRISRTYGFVSYLTTGETQKVLQITPSASSLNYGVYGKVYAKVGQNTQIMEIYCDLRSNTLPSLAWQLYYDEDLDGITVPFVKPVLWKNDTVGSFILAFEHNSNSVQSITVDLTIAHRYSSTFSDVTLLTGDEVSSIDSGYTSNSFILRRRRIGLTSDSISSSLLAGTALSNNIQLSGAAASSSPTISAVGTDSSIDLNLSSKGSAGSVVLMTSSGIGFRTYDEGSGSYVNYWSARGRASNTGPYLYAQGSDTNVTGLISSKGTGALTFLTNSGSATQFNIAHTASAVNYVQINGGVTANRPVISAQGSDTNVPLGFTGKGSSGSVFINNQNDNIISGATVSLRALGTAQGQKTSLSFQPTFVGTADNNPRRAAEITGGFTSDWGSEYLSFQVGGIDANNTAAIPKEVLRLTNSLASVNYVQITGSATGSDPTISAQGTDTDRNLKLSPKGTGSIFSTSPFVAHSSAFNSMRLRGGDVTGQSPAIATQGSDTNISLAFQSKGAGGIDLAAGSSGVNISNGTTVTALIRTSSGSGYTSIPTLTISAPSVSGGTQATASVTLEPLTWSIASGGTGYTVGDVLTLVGGTWTSQSTQFTVTTVSSGVITGVSQTRYGRYSVLPTNPVSVTGGTGTGATFNVLTWTVSPDFTIANAGSGYLEQPTVTISGGGGSGAAAYATVGSATLMRSLHSTTSLYTPGGESLRVLESSGGVTAGLQIISGSTGQNSSYVYPFGSGSNSNLVLSSKDSGSVFLNSSNGNTTQFRVTHTSSSVNFLNVTGAATTNRPALSAQGSDTNVGLQLYTKNAGMMVFTKYRDATTSSQYLFENAGGLYTDASGGAFWRGFHVGAPNYTVSGANKFPRLAQYFELQSQTDPTFKNSYIALSNASGESIEQNFSNDTGGGFTFRNSSATGLDKSFKIAAPLTTDRNYLQVAGAATGLTPILSAQGTDTNVPIVFQPKGTGAIDLVAGSSGVNVSNGTTVTAITRTATGSGYTSFPTITISAPTTPDGVQATATVATMVLNNPVTVVTGGSGYTVGDILTVVGGTTSGAATMTVTGVSAGAITSVGVLFFGTYSVLPANPISVTGGTGTGATFTATYGLQAGGFNITNAGSGYVEQPTVTFSGGGSGSGGAACAVVGSMPTIKSLHSSLAIQTPSAATTLQVMDDVSYESNSALYVIGGRIGLGRVGLRSNKALYIGSSSNNVISFQSHTSATSDGVTQLNISPVGSAVNYVQVTGAITGGSPTISVQGSDTNSGLVITSKGTGAIALFTGGGQQFRVSNTASAVNYVQATGAAATGRPTISAQGSDTDIDLALSSKGTGVITIKDNSAIDSQTTTTTSTTADQVIAVLSASIYRTAKVVISATDSTGNKYHSTELLIVSDGSAVAFTEYGAINIGGLCATYSVDVSGGNIRLLATPSSSNSTTFKIAINTIKI